MDNISRIEVKKHEANSQNSVSKTGKPCCSNTRSSPVDRVLFLQRTIGNQAVKRFMRSRALHAKLRIGAPGDVYEREADRVADTVMRMPQQQTVSRGTPHIQRVCPKCKQEELKRQPIREEDDDKKLRKKPAGEEEEGFQANAASEINPDVESHFQSIKGTGKPLSAPERAFFEQRFGADFSDVKVHNDTRAAHAAHLVNARAFTIGHDVVFGAGEYAPETSRGRRLVAHELTHVIQQSGGLAKPQIQRAYKPLSPPGDCTFAEHRTLQDNVNKSCKIKRACDQKDDCAAIMQKIQANADCIKARVIINAKCFRGGDPGHMLAVGGAMGALANCWLVYNRKCQVKTPPPVPVTVPEKNPKPVVDKGFMEKMAAITGLTGTALVIYLIISEGSRLFPPRNLVPVP